jgi:hypothetical protein
MYAIPRLKKLLSQKEFDTVFDELDFYKYTQDMINAYPNKYAYNMCYRPVSMTNEVTDNFGNQYNMVIDNGSIVSVEPINIKEVTDLPYIKIISKTGSGARLKPIFGFGKEFSGQVSQVIDCIT